jgi:hypothetical protein
MKVLAFIGRVCSRLKLLQGQPFLRGRQLLKRSLLLDNLRKRHIIVIDRCCMCKKTEESVNHLLLHCDVASALCSALFNRFGMSWVMPRCVINLLAS